MDDSKIIALFNQRSEEALAELAKKYGRLCYSVANGILSSREDTEECVNDAYLRTWNSIPPAQPSKLSAYLCKIVRNLAIDRLTADRREKRGGNLIAEELSDAIPTLEGKDGITDELALKASLNSFLRTLPEKTRAVFIGRYFYCLSVKELAKNHALTESNVKVLLLRTRNALKAHLESQGINV